MTIPVLPNTSSKILLVLGLVLMFISGSLMNDTYQKLTEPSFKMDSLLSEAEYLQSRIADHNRKSREDTIKQYGGVKGATDAVINAPVEAIKSTDTSLGGVDLQSEQLNKLIVQVKIYQARCKWYYSPLDISKWWFYIGAFLSCMGFTGFALDELAETKKKQSRRMY